MSKVLFDGTSMQASYGVKFHGGGEYAKFILKSAIAAGHRFDVVLDPARALDKGTTALMAENGIRTLSASSKKDIYNLIDAGAYDVFYSALPYRFTDYRCRAKLIGVIHGLRPLEIVWDRYKHKFFGSPLKRAVCYMVSKSAVLQAWAKKRRTRAFTDLLSVPGATFLTVSRHSKYALLDFFPNLKPENIHVFYSPFELPDHSAGITSGGSYGKYFLMVSCNRFEKNTWRALKAFDKLFDNGKLDGFSVVLTGASGLPFKNEVRNRTRFHFLPYVDTDELNGLYSGAFALVYPSLNEGFGYPPLQAMAAGVPVIASSATSIPEVCDGAALMFSPRNIDDLRNRILQIAGEENLRRKLTEAGHNRVKYFQELQARSTPEYLKLIFNGPTKGENRC